MVRSSHKLKQLKAQAEQKAVVWCPFYQMVADEASSKRNWPDEPIINLIVKLHDFSLYDQRTCLDFFDTPDGKEALGFKAGVIVLLQSLPKPVEPVQTFLFNICYKNKKGTSSEKPLKVEERHMNVDFCVTKIQSMFNTKLARLRITIDEEELTEETLRQCMEEDPGRQHEVYVENMQKGFSSFQDIDEALRLVGKNAQIIKDVDFFANIHPLTGFDDEVDLAFKCIEALGPIVSLTGACEATKRIFIDPILVAAARIVKDVTMDVEREVESPDANGPVDYIFKNNGRTICVTEGKYEKQDSGVSQNLAQLTAVREEMSRKRKIDQISEDNDEEDGEEGDDVPLYGIATTYVEWQFLVLQGEKVRITKRFQCVGSEKVSVSNIISMVAAMLRDGKVEV